jgi:hypothetical protein
MSFGSDNDSEDANHCARLALLLDSVASGADHLVGTVARTKFMYNLNTRFARG